MKWLKVYQSSHELLAEIIYEKELAFDNKRVLKSK